MTRLNKTYLLALALLGIVIGFALLPSGDASTEVDSPPQTSNANTKKERFANMIAARHDYSLAAIGLGDDTLGKRINKMEPYTVFAPSDNDMHPVMRQLAKISTDDSSKSFLGKIISRHIVPGYFDFGQLSQDIDRSPDGIVRLKTITEDPILVQRDGDHLLLGSKNGNIMKLTGDEISGTGGVIHLGQGILIKEKL